MAMGFGNTGAVTFSSFAYLTGSTAQQIGGPSWSAASGDITPIGAADDILRVKAVSGRHNQEPINIPFFVNPATMVNPATSTASGTLVITYPSGATTFSMLAGMTRFKMGDLIDDEIMMGECELLPLGGAALDGTN